LKEKNNEQIQNCLNRAFELIDLTIATSYHQKDLKELLLFRDVLSQFYIDEDKNLDEFIKILKTLLMFNKFTSIVRI